MYDNGMKYKLKINNCLLIVIKRLIIIAICYLLNEFV